MELAEPRGRSEYSISRKPKYSLRWRYREVGESLSVLLFGAEQSIGPQGYWIFDPRTVSSIQNSRKLFTTLGGNVSPRMRTLFRVTIRGNGLVFACSVNEACRNALSRAHSRKHPFLAVNSLWFCRGLTFTRVLLRRARLLHFLGKVLHKRAFFRAHIL